MEFDKSRIYTAVNAEELPIGSRCVFADTIEELKSRLLNVERYIDTLDHVCNEDEAKRFQSDDTTYLLAYLIEPPKKPEYKPFSSTEKAMEAIQKHGGWIRNKEKDEICLVTGVTNSDFGIIVFLAGYYGINSTNLIHERFSFFDDGSPCGELMEERPTYPYVQA